MTDRREGSIMKRKTLVVAAVVALCSTSASAREPHPVEAASQTALSGFAATHPEASVFLQEVVRLPRMLTGLSVPVPPGGEREVRHLLLGWAAVLGIDLENGGLSLRRVNESRGSSFYRYQQTHGGLPVEGGEVVAAVLDDRIVHVTSSVRLVGEVETRFVTERDEAREAALSDLRRAALIGGDGNVKTSVTAFLLGRGARLIPAYRVETVSYEPAGHWRSYLDGRSGTVIGRLNLVKHARGNVYMDTPEVSGTTTEVDLEDLTSPTFLSGTYVDVYSNCRPGFSCADEKRLAKADASRDFLYQPAEPDENDPFSEVMAYYHINRAHDWFKSHSLDTMDWVAVTAVNATSFLLGMTCNAGYTDRTVIVGMCKDTDLLNKQKRTVNFAYDADILVHEYGHGYVWETSALQGVVDELGLNLMADGLNEGAADMISGFVNEDDVYGRHSLAVLGDEHVRDFSKFASCPENLYGEPHFDGRIFDSATWEATRGGREGPVAQKAVLLAIASLTGSSTFKDAAAAVVSFASQLGGSDLASKFQAAYDAHGLSDCGRLVEVPNGYRAGGHLLPALNPGLGQYQPHMVQYVYTVPPGATSASSEIKGAEGYAAFYVNFGAPVTFDETGTTATYRWSNTTAETINSPPPGKYYMLIVFEGKDAVDWSFSFTAQGPGIPTVTSVSPSTVGRGGNVSELTVGGTGFQDGARIAFPHPLAVSDPEFVNATTLRAKGISVPANTPLGAMDVYVFNPDGRSAIGKGLLTVEEGSAPDGGTSEADSGIPTDTGPKGDAEMADGAAKEGPPSEASPGSEGGCSCSVLL
jgi:Zn-dependent metalloprotease